MTAAELKGARLNKGLSLRAAAAEIGVSRETLRLLELGATPRAAVGKRVADFYGVAVTDIWPVKEAVAS